MMDHIGTLQKGISCGISHSKWIANQGNKFQSPSQPHAGEHQFRHIQFNNKGYSMKPSATKKLFATKVLL